MDLSVYINITFYLGYVFWVAAEDFVHEKVEFCFMTSF